MAGDSTEAREALSSTDVTLRAAAVRTLSECGEFDDVPKLLELAAGDKSPSVRLIAAGAVADISLRTKIGPARRKVLLDALRMFDPARNPSLLMILAAVPDREGLERLGRLLRDPRSDVRSGAATALRRMTVAGVEAALVSKHVRTWLLEGRHPPDAVAELIRLAGEAGWADMEEAFTRAASAGRTAAAASEQALQWVVARRDPTSWAGLWSTADGVCWLYVDANTTYGPTGDIGALELVDGEGRLPGLGPVRRLWSVRAADDPPADVVQCDGKDYTRRVGAELCKAVDQLAQGLVAVPAVALGIARDLVDMEGSVAQRARATALWRGGSLREAERVLERIVEAERKPKPEVAFVLANVKVGLGDFDSAREAIRLCLSGAPKRAPYRAEAEALLVSLRG